MKIILAICITGAVLAHTISGQIAGPVQPATVPNVSGLSAGGGSFTPKLSGDGRYVVFVSQAKNLVTNGSQSPFLDVFVRDITSGATKLVSVNRSGIGGGDGDSNYPTISSNGQFIAFESTASNLTTNSDTNGVSDVFVRDMVAGTTWMVSKSRDGTGSGSGVLKTPIISRDGNTVLFESAATNITVEEWDDTNGLSDVFVHDLLKHATHLVSTGAIGDPSSAKSEASGISANGDWVVFTSTAAGMVPEATNTQGEIYVRWTASSPIYWISSNVTTLLSDNRKCFNPVMSEDGNIVVFKVMTNGPSFTGSPVFVVRHNRSLRLTEIIGTNSTELSWPSLSGDGRYSVFESQGLCGTEIVRRDSWMGTNAVVSVDLGGTVSGSGDATTPVMTRDGSKVGFLFTFVARDSAFCLGGSLTTNLVSDKAQLFLRDMYAGNTRLISGRTDGTPGSESLANIEPSLNDDGSKVAFESGDKLLVAEDRNGMSDVFLYRVAAGTTELVSQRDSGLASQTSMGLNYLKANCLSADGRFAVFASLDGNVVPDDTNGVKDVFVLDLLTGSNSLVTITFGTAAGDARDPVISGSGEFVAFVQEHAGELGSQRWDVMLRDLKGKTNTVVSLSQSGTNANGDSWNPAISFDGRYVAFESTAGNLVSGSSGTSNVFERDIVAGSNILVSVNWMGANAGDGVSKSPMISRTGRWVVFQSKASDLTTNAVSGAYYQLYARDLLLGKTMLLSAPEIAGNSRAVSFSASGNVVLFSTDAARIYVADLLTGTNQLVSASGMNPCISGDGRWVAYEETNTYLGIHQIALQDLRTGGTRLVTSDLANPSFGNGHSVTPVITFDGRYVVFASKAIDLVPGDTNGMLARDGSGDFDGDGATDAQEFLAGTDPTNAGVAFRTLTLSSLGGGATRILWSASPGKNYRVEYKTNLTSSPWLQLPGQAQATGGTASAVDNSATGGQRFYRAVLVP